MLKSLYGFTILLLLHLSSFSQKIPGDRAPIPGDETQLLAEFKKSTSATEQTEALLNLSAYYLYLSGEEKEDLDKAMQYQQQAYAACIKLNFQDGYNEAMILKANIYSERGDKKMAKAIFDSVSNDIEKLRQFCKINQQPERETRALRQISTMYLIMGNNSGAEKCYQEILNIYKSNHFINTHYTYERLCSVYMSLGDFNKALFYGLEMIRAMENSKDYSSAGSFYFDLGFIYRYMGQFQKAIDYYQMAFDFYKKNPTAILWDLTQFISEAMSKMQRSEDAIAFISTAEKQFPPQNKYAKKAMEQAYITCYRVLKQYEFAQVHLKKMIELLKDEPELATQYKKTAGQLYTEWGKYELARPYIEACLEANYYGKEGLSHLHFLMFKIDSAAGNYTAAIAHLMKNKAYDDTIYMNAKIRENKELQIKYETEKKDQELKFKGNNILLLNKQTELQRKNLIQAALQLELETKSAEQNHQISLAEAEKKDKDITLKQQNIELLEKQKQLQQSEIRSATTSRNMFIGGAILLFLVLILVYNSYLMKRRSNKQLEIQQIEINNKNNTLLHLITEKEWLLKEVHHRVKNNLQTVVSLLQSQSEYLQNDALIAMQDGQNRVHAMSLIHQKLYQDDNVSSINMPDYIAELVNYLSDSFNIKRQLYFNLDIQSITLDVSQAVSVGLILNEAITNSIKYAFPDKNRQNKISISMKKTGEKRIELVIADNGIGLPEDPMNIKPSGLGFKLMKGLTQDLEGEFSIQSHDGTAISLNFIESVPLNKIMQKG